MSEHEAPCPKCGWDNLFLIVDQRGEGGLVCFCAECPVRRSEESAENVS